VALPQFAGCSSAKDPRTPDINLKVNTGVIFTGGTKLAEHGGFNEDDVHTALLVSFPRLQAQTVKGAVTNQTGCGDHRARARARPQ
jgi:hypothetical protein